MKKEKKELLEELNNDELVTEKVDYKKKLAENNFYKFFKVFVNNLKESKLYSLSFIITLIFLSIVSINKVKESEGFYKPSNREKEINTNVTPVVDKSSDDITNILNSNEKVDVTDYIGIYSKEVKLDKSIYVDSTCNIDSYKLVYQIKKDNTITKYITNKCMGTYKIWSDNLKYNYSSGAKYISAKGINYLFSNGLREVDGDTYNLEDDITSIKVNIKIDSLKLYFFDNNVVFMTLDNLYLVKGSLVDYDLGSIYKNNGGYVNSKRVYKSSVKNQFNFIVFDSGDSENACYLDSESDEVNYSIYSIKYDSSKEEFTEAKLSNTRYKKDGCEVYKQDIKDLED